MYRDDLAATHARVDSLEAELSSARGQAVQDGRQIERLQSELQKMRDTIDKLGGRAPASPIYSSRGGAILALGICSLVVCSILGPIAWVMGNTEMRRIRRGETSADNESATVAGRVCGIIGTAILACVVIAVVVLLAAHPMHRHHY